MLVFIYSALIMVTSLMFAIATSHATMIICGIIIVVAIRALIDVL